MNAKGQVAVPLIAEIFVAGLVMTIQLTMCQGATTVPPQSGPRLKHWAAA